MTNMIDKRIKVATNEQEYAHNYPFEGKNEEYVYSYEKNKIDGQIDNNQEKVYDVEIDNLNDNVNLTKIRVKTNKETILEDHRQQSYKIRTKPQFKTTDVVSDKSNEFREEEVQKMIETSQHTSTRIMEDNQKDLTSPEDRYSTYEEEVTEDCGCDFELHMKVAHVEEGIVGKIQFINDKRLTVTWEDNTRERFSLAEAREFLSYISDVQTQVSPTQSSPFPKDDSNPALEKALKALESDTDNDDEEVLSSKIDIEKAKLQRQVHDLQHNIESSNIQKIKEKAANDLVDLMLKKGMLAESEIDNQFNTIMKMDDIAFDTFQKAIISTKTKSDEIDDIYAALEDEIDDDIEIEDGEEFARISEAMKKSTGPSRTVDGIEMGDTSFFENGGLSGFKGTVGGFGSSSDSGSTPSQSSQASQARSLSSASSERKTVQRTASERRSESNGLDLSGFKDLQGLKAPINIPVKEVTAGSKFDDLFSSMDWTILSKK